MLIYFKFGPVVQEQMLFKVVSIIALVNILLSGENPFEYWGVVGLRIISVKLFIILASSSGAYVV